PPGLREKTAERAEVVTIIVRAFEKELRRRMQEVPQVFPIPFRTITRPPHYRRRRQPSGHRDRGLVDDLARTGRIYHDQAVANAYRVAPKPQPRRVDTRRQLGLDQSSVERELPSVIRANHPLGRTFLRIAQRITSVNADVAQRVQAAAGLPRHEDRARGSIAAEPADTLGKARW